MSLALSGYDSGTLEVSHAWPKGCEAGTISFVLGVGLTVVVKLKGHQARLCVQISSRAAHLPPSPLF